MKLYFKCSFQHSDKGFCSSKYDLDNKCFVDDRKNDSKAARNILDTTLGKSLVLSVSEKNTWLLSILGLVYGNDEKMVNVVMECDNKEKILKLYYYIYNNYEYVKKQILASVTKYNNSYGYDIDGEKIKDILDKSDNGNSNIIIGRVSNNELIFFEPKEEYDGNYINANELFWNKPRNIKNELKKSSIRVNKTVEKLLFAVVFVVAILLVIIKLINK